MLRAVVVSWIVVASAPALAQGVVVPTSTALATVVAAPAPHGTAAARWSDTARVLGGLDIDRASPLASLERRASVRKHQRDLDSAWNAFTERRLAPMQRFSARELGGTLVGVGPVYYPFSGPDALHALALFPRVTEFVFTGLEPVGEVPDLATLDENALRDSLGGLRRSLASALEWSFFRTHEMKVDLARNRLEGVTPILLLFLARHDFAVVGVEPFVLDRSGGTRDVAASALDALTPGDIAGVRVRFVRAGDVRERRITYLAADLSDAGLAKTPQYLDFVRRAGTRTTLIKSASYLMHDDAFARIRAFILESSRMIVQDDSGIPLRFYAERDWTRRLYGTYNGPIPLFNNRMQKDVRQAYLTEGSMPIDFVYGYNFGDRGNNLQRFTSRGTGL